MKIATTLNLQTMVQVSSMAQLLAVLDPVSGLKGLQGLSVSSRNVRLWKIDSDKAASVLSDPQCLAAIKAYSTGSDRRLVVVAEGLAAGQVITVMDMGVVDAVGMGEELIPMLLGGNNGYRDAINKYIGYSL